MAPLVSVFGIVCACVLALTRASHNFANNAPIARMITATVERNSEVVITFQGYDVDGDKLDVYIVELPEVGTVNQLSQVFSDYGHNPKKGKPITAASMSNRVHVTGSKNRVVYSPPPNTNYPRGKWGIMKFIVSDGLEESEVGMVWLVPPHQRMVYSDFSLDVDGWYVTNNGAREAAKPHGGLIHEPYGRGLLNHYVVATDAEIHINRATGDDDTRWYFNAPGGFHGNHVVAYGGYLEFSLGSSAGDFSKLNGNPMFVELECATCERHSGIRLAVFGDSSTYKLDGQDRRYRIPLVESAWKKDPKNTLLSWNAPSKCDMVEVLSGITSLRILGDHTVWYESIALDDVAFVHGKSVPVSCASIYY